MKHLLLTTIAAVVLVGCGESVRELVSEKEAERPEDTIISRESVRELLSEKDAERPEDAIVSRFSGSTPTSSGITRESQMASYFENGK